MIFNPIKSSKLAKAILYRVVLFSSVVTLLLSGIQLYLEFRNDYSQVQKIQKQIDSSYIKSLETAIWGINKVQARALIEGIAALPTVKNVSIFDENDDFYISHLPIKEDKLLKYSKTINSPLDVTNQKIATLHVYQSHELAYTQLRKRIFFVLLTNFVKTFFVALFILFLLHKLVARHLITISNFLKSNHNIFDGKQLILDRPETSLTSNDELDTLAKAFNHQNQTLKDSWQDLALSEKRYRELTEGSLQGILLLNENWSYVYANQQFFQLLGLKYEDDFIANVKNYFDKKDAKWISGFIKRKERAPTFKDDIKLINNDKTSIYVQAILMRSNLDNKPIIQIVVFDVSNLKKLKDKQKNIEIQLIQKNKMAALGRMLSGVTHEMNNPNHLINQNALILKETWQAISPNFSTFLKESEDKTYNNLSADELLEVIPELIDDISLGSNRITNIVNDLKSFIRQEEHTAPELCDLNKIIEDTCHILRTTINNKCLNFELNLAPDLEDIWCYKERLSQVFVNLIINALEAIPKNSNLIRLSTFTEENLIIFRIFNQGATIPIELKDKIFDAFYSTKTNVGGTGLGLAICQSIISQHHGKLAINENIKDGTEFYIEFKPKIKPINNMLGTN